MVSGHVLKKLWQATSLPNLAPSVSIRGNRLSQAMVSLFSDCQGTTFDQRSWISVHLWYVEVQPTQRSKGGGHRCMWWIRVLLDCWGCLVLCYRVTAAYQSKQGGIWAEECLSISVEILPFWLLSFGRGWLKEPVTAPGSIGTQGRGTPWMGCQVCLVHTLIVAQTI